jgi:hypothetical protein
VIPVLEYDEDLCLRVNEEDLLLDNCDILLIGGPVSNRYGGKLSGYSYKSISLENKEIVIPVFKSGKTELRWGFFCGDENYGFFEGDRKLANRWEAGEIVTRPLYGVIDNTSNAKPKFFRTNPDNFVEEDALLVTKIFNPLLPEKAVVIIASGFGYSISAFAKNLELNLGQISALIGKSSFFQLYLPVYLKHEKYASGYSYTNAYINWKEAKKFEITNSC